MINIKKNDGKTQQHYSNEFLPPSTSNPTVTYRPTLSIQRDVGLLWGLYVFTRNSECGWRQPQYAGISFQHIWNFQPQSQRSLQSKFINPTPVKKVQISIVTKTIRVTYVSVKHRFLGWDVYLTLAVFDLCCLGFLLPHGTFPSIDCGMGQPQNAFESKLL